MNNVIFLGSSGVHHTLLAAHLYIDPECRRDYQNLPHFNDYHQEAGGHLIYIGSDREGRRVHSLGVGSDVEMVRKTLDQLRIILDSSADELQLIPIIIKSQRLITFIHQLSRLACLKSLSSKLILNLLNQEHDYIKEQILSFTDPVL